MQALNFEMNNILRYMYDKERRFCKLNAPVLKNEWYMIHHVITLSFQKYSSSIVHQ